MQQQSCRCALELILIPAELSAAEACSRVLTDLWKELVVPRTSRSTFQELRWSWMLASDLVCARVPNFMSLAVRFLRASPLRSSAAGFEHPEPKV